MADINVTPQPVFNPNIQGYGTGELSALAAGNPAAYTDTSAQLQNLQLNYDAALVAAGGNTNDVTVVQAREAYNQAATEANVQFDATSAVNALQYQARAGTVGTGSLLGAQLTKAQDQQTLFEQRRSVNTRDWRVRLSLAPAADYLYKDPTIRQENVLWPLVSTQGVIFPYTPSVNTIYNATYNPVNLTHSNHIQYFYQGSGVTSINITGTFTAQDTTEAKYLLAVIHFFRTATKMFYGQDAQAGAPPPLLFLSGFGQYQFNQHPVVVSSFNYQLPADVDYIRADSFNVNGSSLLTRRGKNSVPNTSFDSAINRLKTLGTLLGMVKGANPQQIAQSSRAVTNELGGDRPTYVPTKIDITLALLPVQTRSQISKQFSVKAFANGDLLRGGFW